MAVAAVEPPFWVVSLLLCFALIDRLVHSHRQLDGDRDGDGYGTLDYFVMKQAVGVLPAKIYF